jgi:predicted  nucleic acid-binding Zn-ribbon protein
VHPDLEQLRELERVDREIAGLNADIAALPHRVAAIEAKLASVNAQVERARNTLKETEKNRRKYEGEIQTLQQKISKYRDQMLAVKTNQEYRALGDEITFAENQIRAFEDKILEGMLDTEARELEVKAAEIEQKAQQAQVEKEKAEARTRTEQMQGRVGELKPRREQLRSAINPDLVRHYDRVLKLRGSAVAEAVDQKCTACHVLLRPQVYQDILSGQVMTCDSCGRILYHEALPQPQAAAAQDSNAAVAAPAVAEVPEGS